MTLWVQLSRQSMDIDIKSITLFQNSPKGGKELLLVGMDLRPTCRKDTWAEYDAKKRRLNEYYIVKYLVF